MPLLRALLLLLLLLLLFLLCCCFTCAYVRAYRHPTNQKYPWIHENRQSLVSFQSIKSKLGSMFMRV